MSERRFATTLRCSGRQPGWAILDTDERTLTAGYRPSSAIARSSALEEPRQIAEDAGRITAGDGRLSGRQRDIARGVSKACDRIDDKQDRIALIAEIFGDRHRVF